MPGGRGTINDVVETYLAQVDKVNDKKEYTEAMRVEVAGKIGDMMVASIEPNYQIGTYEEGYNHK